MSPDSAGQSQSPDSAGKPQPPGTGKEPDTGQPPDLPFGPDPDKDLQLDARSLRGLAHPVRVRMLGLLRDDGPATATGLARRLGLNTGATSYHLRQLAAHGFVVEDTSRGTGRDRWWRVAHRYTWFDISSVAPEDQELGAAYLRAVVQTSADRMLRAVDELPALPEEWRRTGTFSEFPLQLAPDELERLLTEVYEVLGRYRPAPEPGSERAPAGTAPVAFQVQAFPRPGALTAQDEPTEAAPADAPTPDDEAAAELSPDGDDSR